MTCNSPCEKPLEVGQGLTFQLMTRWSTDPLVYKPVSAVVTPTPLTLTVTAHGMVDGFPAAFTELGGLGDLNSDEWPPQDDDDFYTATVVDANTLLFDDVDAARFGVYTSGGSVGYFTPVSLSGLTAAFKLYRNTVSALNLVPVLDNTAKTILTTFSTTDTAGLARGDYTWALEVTDGSGNVTLVDSGKLTVFIPGVDVDASCE